jgi:hypothetical protein
MNLIEAMQMCRVDGFDDGYEAAMTDFTPQPIETHPKQGRFWAWWRTRTIKRWTGVTWDDDGRYLVCDGGVVVHEPEVDFSHWLPEPSEPVQ